MPLFGRRTSADVENVLREMLNATEDRCAVARNLMHDHRVAEPREKALRELFTTPMTVEALESAVKLYAEHHVRYTGTPDFVEDAINAENILAGTALGAHQVSKDLALGRVLNLAGAGMREFYVACRERRVKAFAMVPGDDPMNVKKWIDGYMEDPDKRDGFVARVLAHLWPQRDALPVEPCWATTWDVLEAVADEPASRWAEVVGVPPAPGDWLILLKYRVRETGTLVRPTQLDAGWNARHFPSPPTTPLAGGGHPMDLGGDGCRAALRPEFIHQQITHTPAHWIAAGKRVQKVDEVVNERDLVLQRVRHWTLLQSRDGDVIRAWMPKPM